MTTAEAVSIRDAIREIKGSTDDIEEQARVLWDDYLDDEQRRTLGLAAARHQITKFESDIRKPRSGHQNASGRFEGVAAIPGRGVLAYEMTVGGVKYELGELTLTLLDEKIGEYDAEIGRLEFRRAPVQAVRDALKRARKQRVCELGEERVEALWNAAADV